MKLPRVHIVGFMVAVVIVALNLGVIRALLTLESPLNSKAAGMLGLGALPMVNVLAIRLLVTRERSGTSMFSRGFEACGAAALVVYIATVCLFTEPILIPYLYTSIGLASKIVGQYWPGLYVPILYFVAVVMLAVPQLVIALIGGLFLSEFRVTLTRFR